MQHSDVTQLIEMALLEDIGDGDVTSEYFVPKDADCKAFMLVKQEGVIAGLEIARAVFIKVDPKIRCSFLAQDGDKVAPGTRVMEIIGNTRSVLTAERVALNFVQRLSGVATKTAEFVELANGESTILDTRKTTPGWRRLEKYAVTQGGGSNHRMGLYDRAMIKDNHLVANENLGELQSAILKLKSEKPNVEVELEADTLDQVNVFLKLDGVDYILLDNMTNEQIKRAVSMRGKAENPKLEASGGVNLETVESIASTGVDFISVGTLTHSAVALDVSLDILSK